MDAKFGILSVAVLSLLLAACQTTGGSEATVSACATPLPSNLKVQRPADRVPAELAKFSGRWGNGKWDGKMCHTLVVEEVTHAGSVTAVYSWGTYAGWDLHEGFRRHAGVIEDGKLTLNRFGNGAQASYQFDGDGLRGKYVGANGGIVTVALSKLK